MVNPYTDYIGIPFKYGGRDRKELDCYGLVMLLYKELKGIEIPDVISPQTLAEISTVVESQKQSYWQKCEPKEGAVLIFGIKGYGAHVGYMLDNDRMIHTWEKTSGVTIERLSINGWNRRLLGCYEYANLR